MTVNDTSIKYDFDTIIDRKSQNSKKWNDWTCLGRPHIDPDVLPMWIADMDFHCEPRILQALKQPTDWGIIGYDALKNNFYDSFMEWQYKKNNWHTEKEWFVPTPGVVPGIATAIKALTQEHDKILIQPPVYPPFFKVITLNNRTLVENNLIYTGTRYEIDFPDFEQKIKDCRMMILCSPHNPVGRVWTQAELEKIVTLCIKHNVIIVSDEIHSDLLLYGNKHTVTATMPNGVKDITITLSAPSKTFNIAGLSQSVAIIPNAKLREAFQSGLDAMGIMHVPTFGIVGFSAAYTYGEQWLMQVLKYIEKNVNFTIQYVNENIPQIKTHRIEGTYLMWFDFRNIDTDRTVINDLLYTKGKVLFDYGIKYGAIGDRFYRVNIGCPRSIVQDGLERIKKALS